MRVLIVSANQEQKPDPVVPLGAAWVAAAAESAGHDVSLFDACFRGDQAPEQLRRAIETSKPDVVGLSLRNIDDVAWPNVHSYLPQFRRLVQVIRAVAPRALLVLGGSAFTLIPERFMHELAADCGVAGAGEAAFVSLLGRMEAGGPQGLRGSILRGGGIPGLRPALHLLDLGAYYARGGALNVQTRRGCEFKCSYCTYPILEGTRTQLQGIEGAVDDMHRAKRDHDARHFFVVDNTFNHPADHAAAFCEHLIARGLNVRWTAYLSPLGTTQELLDLMARAGCSSVEYGTDAASPATLAALRKPFGVADVVAASAHARAAGIRFAHSLILGGPEETSETIRETVRVVASTNPTAVFGMLGVRVYPGAGIAARAEREGLIRQADIGIEPVFYISEHVRDALEDTARAIRAEYSNWYFPGLEGERWIRFWRRRRANGVRGPLWEWMGEATSAGT